ncbi:hypothetical protein HN018_10555 [Lichenicola cladoniae]|uniref:Photosynthesis system II assembly factor Ycf48/Hcf136-like domain-containing protein n=1 Tax=Lichenicola cladoniae TaxID=1484109 RepID=A0A6M8HQ72_9PROT|nr:YCF48-related protein [Lichenicola cladoniae]NPD69713.1 hypothetical protein [Acetobacteraceae bacterium]QKE90415.1 hypothetical protein HN018_10555 [Lichenicola cladoniae]
MSNQQDPLPPGRAVLAIALALAVSTQAARAEPTAAEHDRGSMKTVDARSKPAPHQATTPDPVPIAAPPIATVVAPVADPTPAVVPAPPPKPADPLATPSKMIAHPDKAQIETVVPAGRRLVAGGADGLIMLSDDSGATWRQVQLPVATTITGLRFTDERSGWAVGHSGAVLRTVDSGEHWALVFDGVRAAQATLDAARSANAADSIRQKKIEAAQRLLSQDTARPFLLIQAGASGPVRLIGSANLAIASDDAGKSWHPWSDAIENPDGRQVYGLAQRNGITLVAGELGLVLAGKPEDGLRKLKPPFDGTFFGAIDGGPHGLVIFGQQGRAYSIDLAADWAPGKTVNWRRIADPSPTTLTAALLQPDGTLLLADASGATWKLQGKPDEAKLTPYGATAPYPILALAEAPDQSLILAGRGGVLRVPAQIVPGSTPPGTVVPAPVPAAPAPVPAAPASLPAAAVTAEPPAPPPPPH